MKKLRLLDLFSGIGGLSLGLEMSGAFQTSAFCEIDPYCRSVLKKHWPEVPICHDIRTMETYRRTESPGNGFIRARSFNWEGSRKIRGEPPRNVGHFTSAHDHEESDCISPKEAENSNKGKAPSESSPLPLQSGSHHAGANQGCEGAGYGLREMRGTGDGHRPHSCSVAGWSDNSGKSSASMPHMSCEKIARRKEDISDVGQIDAICGGFPCTDISGAGKRAGIEGEQSGLWYEYARLIGELRPRYVIVENVADLLVRGIDEVLRTLAALGYDAEWHCIQACDVGAFHIRDRVFIIAYPSGGGQYGKEAAQQGEGAERLFGRSRFFEGKIKAEREKWWPAEPYIPRVAYGVPSGLDRCRILGNAVVPQIAKIIGEGIKKHESLKNPIDC